MLKFAEVMKDGGDEESSYGPKDEYSSYVSGLKSALGLEQGKAEELAQAICGLVRYEQEGAGEESEDKGAEVPSLASVLKKGK